MSVDWKLFFKLCSLRFVSAATKSCVALPTKLALYRNQVSADFDFACLAPMDQTRPSAGKTNIVQCNALSCANANSFVECLGTCSLSSRHRGDAVATGACGMAASPTPKQLK